MLQGQLDEIMHVGGDWWGLFTVCLPTQLP